MQKAPLSLSLRFLLPAVFSALMLVGGCGPSVEPPELHTVKGKVLKADGSPMTKAVITFRSEEHQNYSTRGILNEKGEFTLETIVADGKFPGAGPGAHDVFIDPMMTGDQTTQVMPERITLKEKYTVKSDGENNFTIRLP